MRLESGTGIYWVGGWVGVWVGEDIPLLGGRVLPPIRIEQPPFPCVRSRTHETRHSHPENLWEVGGWVGGWVV